MDYNGNIIQVFKSKLVKSNALIIKIVGVVVAIIVISSGIMFGYNQLNKSEVAVRALNAMYNFTDYYSLEAINMKELEQLTTPQVFNFLKFGSYNATANYMKMDNSSTRVNILKTTNSYIIYNLDNKNLSSSATYIMFYKVNVFGKLEEVHQSEIYSTLNIATSS